VGSFCAACWFTYTPWRQTLLSLFYAVLTNKATKLVKSEIRQKSTLLFCYSPLTHNSYRCLYCKYKHTSAHRWRSSHKIEVIHHAFVKFDRVSGPSGPGYVTPFEFPFPTEIQTLKSLGSKCKHRQTTRFIQHFKRKNKKSTWPQGSAFGTSSAEWSQAGSNVRDGVYLCSNLLLAAERIHIHSYRHGSPSDSGKSKHSLGNVIPKYKIIL